MNKIEYNRIMEQYQEFVFSKISSGNLNNVQVDYLMNCIDSHGNMDECLNDMNLFGEYQNFARRKVSNQQEINYQKTLLDDKIKSCQEDIVKLTTELSPLSIKLNTLLTNSNILDTRYKNFPQNPTYLLERQKLLTSISEVQSLMIPLEEQVEKLKMDLESLQLATT